MFCCSFLVFSELLVMIWGLGLRVVVRYYRKFVASVRIFFVFSSSCLTRPKTSTPMATQNGDPTDAIADGCCVVSN